MILPATMELDTMHVVHDHPNHRQMTMHAVDLQTIC